MLCHHLTKFGGHRHCGKGDMIVVEGPDFTFPRLNPPLLSLKHITCHAHTHGISGRILNDLLVCTLKDVQYWSHICLH